MKTITNFLLFAILLLIACNSNNSDNSTSENNGPDSQQPAAAEEKGINLSLYSLYMFKHEALKLLGINGCYKLVFQFYFTPKAEKNESPILAAYPSKSGNDFPRTNPTHLHYYQISGTDLEGDFYLGDQEILKNKNDNPKGLQNFINDELKGADTCLLFIPAVNPTDKHVYYKIYAIPDPKLKKLEESDFLTLASTTTNPSPPAKAQ